MCINLSNTIGGSWVYKPQHRTKILGDSSQPIGPLKVGTCVNA